MVLAILVFGLMAIGTVNAQSTQDFRFESFSADYYLDREPNKTATLRVSEHLVAIFPNFDQNHGILRAIPNEYENHTVSLNIKSVTSETGRPLNYTTYEEAGNTILKIGDANRFVQGRVEYFISYEMRNVALLLSDHDEFFWDVNGDQWQQPFDSVSARVHIPGDLAKNMQNKRVCFAGYRGQSAISSCTVEANVDPSGETVIEAETTQAMLAGQTLSFALAFSNDTFGLGPEIAREKMVQKIKNILTGMGIIIPPVVVFGFMFRRWRAFGNDPGGRGIIIPEYEPPKGFDVISSSFMLHQNVTTTAVSASIIQMAVDKVIKINEIREKKKLRRDKTDYELVLLQEGSQVSDEGQKVIKAIFGTNTKNSVVKISDITASTTKRTDVYKAIGIINKNLADKLFKSGYFIKDPKKIKNHYLGWAAAPFSIGLMLLFISAGFMPVIGLGVGLLIASVVVFVFAFYMPARTLEGVRVHDALLGVKDYINLAEKDRLEFGQSPEGAEKIASGSYNPNNPKMQVKLFESLLPYAILFGLEKQWGEKFKDIYKASPDWYAGDVNAFNAAYLTSSMHNFTAASSVSFAPASSSSSGGFSGGGAGGGGGGGGGGGW